MHECVSCVCGILVDVENGQYFVEAMKRGDTERKECNTIKTGKNNEPGKHFYILIQE